MHCKAFVRDALVQFGLTYNMVIKYDEEDGLPHPIMGPKVGDCQDDLAIQHKEYPMAWIMLFIAGLFEVVWAFFMKQSDGFTRPLASIITIITMLISFWLLALAMRTIPLGAAYTIWTGIGAVGAFIAGIWLLGEPITPLRILAAALIVSGLILMKLTS